MSDPTITGTDDFRPVLGEPETPAYPYPAAPSPVDTTETRQQAREDEEETTDCPVCGVNGFMHRPGCRVYSYLISALDAARPSADTETRREDGVALIAAERQRQVDAEGWTPEHDAAHRDDALARAAACYAMPSVSGARGYGEDRPPFAWPWHPSWWKPTPHDRVRELVKAGALIAAEIDRLRARGSR